MAIKRTKSRFKGAIRKKMKGMPIILANNITKARKSLA
jgi:hypothetical protein